MKQLENPKTLSIAAGAIVIAASCYFGWLDHSMCQVAILALLAALGIVSKDA